MQSGDTIFRKIFSIIIGIVGGSIFGILIIGLIISLFYLHWLKGMETTGLLDVFYAIIFGAPIGIISGAVISYIKRNSRWWRIFFLISSLFWIYFFTSSLF